jgi:hypothetical protein
MPARAAALEARAIVTHREQKVRSLLAPPITGGPYRRSQTYGVRRQLRTCSQRMSRHQLPVQVL